MTALAEPRECAARLTTLFFIDGGYLDRAAVEKQSCARWCGAI